jgi:hypothetical protein
MITDYFVSGDNVVQLGDSHCDGYRLEVDYSSMSGWDSSEYDVIFTEGKPASGALPQSYPATLYATLEEDYTYTETTESVIWVNFISKILGE